MTDYGELFLPFGLIPLIISDGKVCPVVRKCVGIVTVLVLNAVGISVARELQSEAVGGFFVAIFEKTLARNEKKF